MSTHLNRRIIAFAARLEGVEFSLLGGALVGGALHVGTNAVTKGMLKPNTWRQRVGSAIFQTGVRHQAAGKQIHPFVQRAADALLGPEVSHIYKAGLESTRAARKALSVVPSGAGVASGVSGVVAGRRSPWTERLLKKLPTTPLARGEKARDWGGAAVGGIAAGMVDPVLPAVNIGRTLIAKSSLGNRVLRGEMQKGLEHGSQKGVARTVKDYLLSPSLGVVRDVGAVGHPYAGAVRKAITPRPTARMIAPNEDAAAAARLARIQRQKAALTSPAF